MKRHIIKLVIIIVIALILKCCNEYNFYSLLVGAIWGEVISAIDNEEE